MISNSNTHGKTKSNSEY